jgi:hypothetical protein
VHLWRVQLPSGDASGGTVEVTGGKTAKVSAQVAGNDPESRLLASLSQNKLDLGAIAAAKEAGAAMEADLLVFGGLSREGKSLALDGFALDVKTGQARRLRRSVFDAELLSAGVELYNLAGELARRGVDIGEAVKIPGTVATARIEAGTQVAQVEYGPPPAKPGAGADAEPQPEAPPKDVPRRRPLQK